MQFLENLTPFQKNCKIQSDDEGFLDLTSSESLITVTCESSREQVTSFVDLNVCYGNNDGSIEPGKGFLETCGDCQVNTELNRLFCNECTSINGQKQYSKVNLYDYITVDDNGLLKCGNTRFPVQHK